jgi:hypothetical protein
MSYWSPARKTKGPTVAKIVITIPLSDEEDAEQVFEDLNDAVIDPNTVCVNHIDEVELTLID